MVFLVFSQANKEPTHEALLVQKARTFFRTEVVFLQRHHSEGDVRGEFRVQLTLPGRPAVQLGMTRRGATEDDWRAAEEAERVGQAAGMGALARRCHTLWEIPEDPALAPEILTLCGVLAATELGPVMPPDGSTLYGVRGARLRAESALL
jgi:hypothetical protein